MFQRVIKPGHGPLSFPDILGTPRTHSATFSKNPHFLRDFFFGSQSEKFVKSHFFSAFFCDLFLGFHPHAPCSYFLKIIPCQATPTHMIFMKKFPLFLFEIILDLQFFFKKSAFSRTFCPFLSFQSVFCTEHRNAANHFLTVKLGHSDIYTYGTSL